MKLQTASTVAARVTAGAVAAALAVTLAAGCGNVSPAPKPTKPAVSGKVTATTSGDCQRGKKCPQEYLVIKGKDGKTIKVKASKTALKRCRRGETYPGCAK